MVYSDPDKTEKQQNAKDLVPYSKDARQLALKLGLDPHPVKYWVVDHEEMTRLMAYDGFQDRYPHWRWGMKYYQKKMEDIFTGSHAFEIVINDNPCHAYLQNSNDLATQKSVITHVEAHADFFKNNKAFKDMADINATKQLSHHQKRIEEIIEDEDVSRTEVEEWIDALLCIEDNIDQFNTDFESLSYPQPESSGQISEDEVRENLEDSGFSSVMVDKIMEEAENFEELDEYGDTETQFDDLMKALLVNGMYYDTEREEAVEMKEWQRSIIQMIRKESYYFAPQKMTKFMNEGWASFWQSMMMSHENFASENQIVKHATLMSQVLSSPGMNPYKIGYNLWEYIENTTNREHLVKQLLQVEHITPETIYNYLNEELYDKLYPPEKLDIPTEFTLPEIRSELPERYIDTEYITENKTSDWKDQPWKLFTLEALAHKNFSLIRPENRGFINKIYKEDVEQIYRYLTDEEKQNFESIDEAVDNFDYTYAWERMREIREIYTDSSFIDRFLTENFVEEYNYFAYEPNYKQNEMQVSSTDYQDVKKKLLMELTNFGKPQIKVTDTNHRNSNRLLLEHQYNGINLDLSQAREVITRLHKLWGRPVHIRTVQKEVGKDGFSHNGIELYYEDGEIGQKQLRNSQISHLLERTSYDTTPDNWF